MCGDHTSRSYINVGVGGSPPHVRGPQGPNFVAVSPFGITPACAGTTTLKIHAVVVGRDHPRMCGDHDEAIIYPREIAGSPPHVRGPQYMLFN